MRLSWWQPFICLAAILPFSSSSRYDDPNVHLECPYPYELVEDICLFSPDACTTTVENYEDAQAYCQSQVGGGHLATFTTACQFEGIVKYINEYHGGDGCDFWVGATDEVDEGVFIADNSYEELQPIDGPFFDSTGTTMNVMGTDNLIFASSSFYRITHSTATGPNSIICQTYPKEIRSHSHYPPVYFFPGLADDSSSTAAAGGGGGGGGGGGDTSTVNVDGDSFSSDNTASFSSMPQITVNTHHHHVEKHPKVIIIPTYNTPPHHSKPPPSHTGSSHGGYGPSHTGFPHGGYGHRSYNDSHISVNYEPYVDPEPHVDTPEHMLIDGSLHPNGIAEWYLTQKRTQSQNSPKNPAVHHSSGSDQRMPTIPGKPLSKKPSGPVSTIKKFLKPSAPQLRNLTSSEDFLKKHTKAELLKARTTSRFPATQDVQRQDLISQLLHLIDQVGQEVPYKSIGNVHTESLQSKRLFNKKTKIADEVFQS